MCIEITFRKGAYAVICFTMLMMSLFSCQKDASLILPENLPENDLHPLVAEARSWYYQQTTVEVVSGSKHKRELKQLPIWSDASIYLNSRGIAVVSVPYTVDNDIIHAELNFQNSGEVRHGILKRYIQQQDGSTRLLVSELSGKLLMDGLYLADLGIYRVLRDYSGILPRNQLLMSDDPPTWYFDIDEVVVTSPGNGGDDTDYGSNGPGNYSGGEDTLEYEVDPSSGGGGASSIASLQQKALLNKLCSNSFAFKTIVPTSAGNQPSGWKVSQLKDIYLHSTNPNYFSNLWSIITTGYPAYASIKFQLEIGVPASYPDHVAKSAAAAALNTTMKEIIMSHGYEGISSLNAGGTFGMTFAQLAQIHLQAIIPGARITHNFHTQGVVPTTPISSVNCQ